MKWLKESIVDKRKRKAAMPRKMLDEADGKHRDILFLSGMSTPWR
jgi:hypothetical protein